MYDGQSNILGRQGGNLVWQTGEAGTYLFTLSFYYAGMLVGQMAGVDREVC